MVLPDTPRNQYKDLNERSQTFSVYAVSGIETCSLLISLAGIGGNFAGTSGTSINVASDFRLVLGTLNDNGNIINLSGNAFIQGYIPVPANCFYRTVAQTIDGNGIFNNVE